MRNALFLTLALSAGCASQEGARASDAIHVDSLPKIRLVEEVRIGSLDDPDIGFSQVGLVRFAADGTLIVLDWTTPEFRVYEPDGTFVRRIGRGGDGPGEFRFPVNFGLVADTLWLVDLQSLRTTLYRTSGELLATVPRITVDYPTGRPGLPAVVESSSVQPGALILGRARLRGNRGEGPPDSVRIPDLLFDLQGAVVDTAGWRWERVGGVGPTVSTGSLVDAMLRDLGVRLRSDPLRSLTRDGDSIVIERPTPGRSSEGRVTVLRLAPSGDTVARVRLEYDAVAVERNFADGLIQARLGGPRGPGGDPDELEARFRRALPPPPEFYPPILFPPQVADDGSIWLRWEDHNQRLGGLRYIVLTAEGTVLGSFVLPLPGGSGLFSVTVSEIWAWQLDEFEVPWLVRFRLELP